jgi:tetratricopeptide (TPR) repeat protein
MILFQIRLRPELLADLVLYPPTSALACLLVAQWASMGGGPLDRELTTRDDETTKNIAFADAVSVMGHFLEQGSLAPREAASLLNALHKVASPGFARVSGDREALLTILRGELVGQSAEIQTAIFAELASFMPQSGLGTPVFASALDILATGELVRRIDPKPLLEAYISSISASGYGLTANRITVGGAASLVETAVKAPAELRDKFFSPIDMKSRVAAAAAPEANPFTVNDDTARSLRAHVRILCRGAEGLMESVPEELVDALTSTVRAGALSHAERTRVAAFAATYEADPYRGHSDRPIAADLGAALSALVGEARDKLLSAILEMDEPLVLAQLLGFAPHAVHDRIKGRITALAPEDAGDTRSLPAFQARIDALLSAGLADAAAKYIEVEPSLRTWGKVAGRAVTQLRSELALKLLRGDWGGIAATEPPTDLTASEKDAAIETISFYKALAALNNPAADREGAVQVFTALQRRHPQVAGYTVNLFAAQITSLLGANLFEQLHGEALVRGRYALAQAEQAMAGLRTIGASETEIFTCNKALLFLALGQPDQALEILSSLRAIKLRDRVAAYSAIALDRMGRLSDAMLALDQADEELGKTDIVSAARAHIRSGKRFAAAASVTSNDDPIPRLKEALWDFSQLGPIQQAEVLSESLETLLTKHIRLAAESITSLVPMMQSIRMDSREDDLTALIRAVLSARLESLGWSAPDQSRGGFTSKGNPGERDLVVQNRGATLAIIEAVVCNRSLSQQWMRDELTFHFQKLFGYGQCSLLFHLTYSYLENSTSVLEYLKETAKKDAPAGFSYSDSHEIPRVDSGPIGFIAKYATERDPVSVVFLVLDMEQHAQREAAKAAAETNPRN